MSIKIAIFDLDSTLIYTQIIKKKLIDFLKDDCGFSDIEVRTLYKKVRNKDDKNTFSLERLKEVLEEDMNVEDNKGVFFDESKWLEFKTWFKEVDNSLIVKGASNILSFFKQNKIPVYILTLGVKKWQLDKIRKTGLDKFFIEQGKNLEDNNNIRYTVEEDAKKGKKEEIREISKELGLSNTKGIIFFNDRPDETMELMREFPEMKVIVRREIRDKRYTNEDFEKLKKMGVEVFEDLNILERIKELSSS